MTQETKIVITNQLHDEVKARLEQHGQVDINTSVEPWPAQELGARLQSASAMMGFMTDSVDAAMLRHAPELKIIACALKGYDSFDVPACNEQGVWVSIVPDLLTEPTAELALGLAISLARQVRAGDALVRAEAYRGWRSQLFGTGLADSTVAVIGLGMVGSAIVARLAGFGCRKILGVDPQATHPHAQPTALSKALRDADFVFVAAPLTGSSRHLLGKPELAQSKAGQFIINVGRGSVVDERALARALQSGHIGGYAADVFECEDWALPDRPTAIAPQLLALPNTLFTPHLGSAVSTVRLAIEHRAADNIIAVLEGRDPPDAINKPRLVSAT
jgi:phosphonate dehydrogenase